MVLAQSNRKHRYVLGPLNECVNIVALIHYLVFILLRSILFGYWAFFSVVSSIWRDIFEMVGANNEQTSIEQTHSAKIMIEKENKR